MSTRDRRLHFLALCAALGALFVLGSGGAPVAARPAGQTSGGSAGLVVDYRAGTVATYCLSVPAAGVTGLELLQRTGLAVRLDVVGLGAEICAINGVGCLDPGQPCYCQCQGTPCVFWQFSEWRGGRWVASTLGASSVTVRPGAIEGWGWGKNPPAPTGNALCALAAPAATPTPRPARPTATPAPRPTAVAPTRVPPAPTRTPRPLAPTAPPTLGPTATAPGAPSPSATETPAPTATSAPPTDTATGAPTASPTPIPPSPTTVEAPPRPSATPPAVPTPSPGSAGPPAGYWLFGALAVGLLGLIAWARAARARVS